jgi:hypothetical protein
MVWQRRECLGQRPVEMGRRAEMGRRKEQKEVGWNNPTNRTVYQWTVGQHARSTTWTNMVRNRFRQKEGEIEAFRALEIGAAKWGTRKKNRMNIDGTFRPHQNGAISATFTSDWYLRKGESRDKMGEWLKKATVRSQDQRRMLQANTHSFPWNYWRHKITKGKESNRCDLCRALWIAEGRFKTEDDLPIQTLGHIQHQCVALTEIHTLAHHRCWRIIHTKLGRLASSNGDSFALMGNETPHDTGRKGKSHSWHLQGNNRGRKNMEQKTRWICY